MGTTQTDPTVTTVTAIVAVRIPDGAGFDLTTEAEQRLAAIEGVRAVSVDGLRGIQPGLSATIATVAVTIEATVTINELRERLAETVCIDSIDQLTPDSL
ncbi:hypothetical protein [Halovenus halobia]|uniref:hypothetical protein n=1 Tax=Halovenus halobia TaxID=3396622 RepID=UPI003F55AF18